jgi:RNA polymerase sigma-70 factor, ECF subfamily
MASQFPGGGRAAKAATPTSPAAKSPAEPPLSERQRDEVFKRELTALIPQLRAFARTLTGDATQADDLAQDAMMKAWSARTSFELGTNMKAWTFMILRNQFYSEKRRSWRQSQLDQEAAERTLVAPDDPMAPVALDELRQGLGMLPPEQREALILVGAGGFAYEEAAAICGCAVGTVKSRVSRARRALEAVLEAGDYERDGAPAGDAMKTIMADAERLSARH